MNKLNKYDIDCQKEKTRPIYEKRYKKNGEEYLKKVDEINIEEDLKEKYLEITRIKEIVNNKERLKLSELIEEMSEQDTINEIENYKNYTELDTYQFLNMTQEIQSLYNKMPDEIRKKYKNLSNFTKEYIPEFLEETKKNFEIKKSKAKENEIINTKETIEKQIEKLQQQLKENNDVQQ